MLLEPVTKALPTDVEFVACVSIGNMLRDVTITFTPRGGDNGFEFRPMYLHFKEFYYTPSVFDFWRNWVDNTT